MLYIIDQFPVDPSSLEKTTYGDTILFTKNAVLALERSSDMGNIKKALAHINLCVQGADLKRRGLGISDLLCGVSILDERDMQEIHSNDQAIRSWN